MNLKSEEIITVIVTNSMVISSEYIDESLVLATEELTFSVLLENTTITPNNT